MKEYVVYFDVFGKKLKTTVKAKNPEKAGQYVRETIEIIKIVETGNNSSLFDNFFDEFEDMFNTVFGKKDKK